MATVHKFRIFKVLREKNRKKHICLSKIAYGFFRNTQNQILHSIVDVEITHILFLFNWILGNLSMDRYKLCVNVLSVSRHRYHFRRSIKKNPRQFVFHFCDVCFFIECIHLNTFLKQFWRSKQIGFVLKSYFRTFKSVTFGSIVISTTTARETKKNYIIRLFNLMWQNRMRGNRRLLYIDERNESCLITHLLRIFRKPARWKKF